MDWLRALAAILVVMLHAAIPYMSNPLPGLYWSIPAIEQSDVVNLLGWGIDGFVMPVFFIMNGYFAARLLQQRGAGAFLRHRLSRIGGPFLLACVLILPMDLYIWMTGWVICDLISLDEMLALKIHDDIGNTLHGVCHLWFLQYVLLYCLGACWLTQLLQHWRFMKPGTTVSSKDRDRAVQPPERSFGSRLAMAILPLLAGILMAGSVLWWQPRIVIGFRHHWVPMWENLIFYLVPFSLGWFWERHSAARLLPGFRWGVQLLLAGMVFVVLWPGLVQHLHHETIPAARARVPFLFAAFGILMSTGLFGGLLNLPLRRVPAVIAYLSKASFWIYLFHHPVVSLMQVNLLHVKTTPLIKFGISTLVGVLFCLLTYEGLVRKTILGRILNGVREPSGAMLSLSRAERARTKAA